jgi:hypothetical protein
VRIRLSKKDIHLHVSKNKESRIAFIFTQQVAIVERAYKQLCSDDEVC